MSQHQKTTQQQLNAAVAKRVEIDHHINSLGDQLQAARKRRAEIVAHIIDLERSLTP